MFLDVLTGCTNGYRTIKCKSWWVQRRVSYSGISVMPFGEGFQWLHRDIILYTQSESTALSRYVIDGEGTLRNVIIDRVLEMQNDWRSKYFALYMQVKSETGVSRLLSMLWRPIFEWYGQVEDVKDFVNDYSLYHFKTLERKPSTAKLKISWDQAWESTLFKLPSFWPKPWSEAICNGTQEWFEVLPLVGTNEQASCRKCRDLLINMEQNTYRT